MVNNYNDYISGPDLKELITIIVTQTVRVLIEKGFNFNDKSLFDTSVVNGSEPGRAWFPKPVLNNNQAMSGPDYSPLSGNGPESNGQDNDNGQDDNVPDRGKIIFSSPNISRETFYATQAGDLSPAEKFVEIEKLVTEEAVLCAVKKNISLIRIRKNTIVTPLARDTAREKKIEIREDL